MADQTSTTSPDAFLPLSQLARRLPPGRGGKRVSPSTLTRWVTDGVTVAPGGPRVRLKAVRVGGRWLVREAWWEAFVAALTGARVKPADGGAGDAVGPGERDRAGAAAAAELAAMGA